jgi:endonuclease/exonuclease/phosphatase family metal-dependent hydrolase
MASLPRSRQGLPATAVAVFLLALSSCASARNYPDRSGPRFTGAYAPAPPLVAPATLTVVSFNIKFGRYVDRAIEVFREAEPLRRPDVVVLQEMDEGGVDRLARALSMNYVYYPAAVLPGQRDFGNAILSRWPILADSKIALPHPGRFRKMRRIAVGATLDVAGRPARVYSVHLETPLGIGGRGREEQVEAVLADAAAYPRVVLAGDFNSHDIGRFLEHRGFAWPTRGLGHTISLFTWDHVFVRGLSADGPGGTGVVQDNRGASDHRPVWAALRLLPAVGP